MLFLGKSCIYFILFSRYHYFQMYSIHLVFMSRLCNTTCQSINTNEKIINRLSFEMRRRCSEYSPVFFRLDFGWGGGGGNDRFRTKKSHRKFFIYTYKHTFYTTFSTNTNNIGSKFNIVYLNFNSFYNYKNANQSYKKCVMLLNVDEICSPYQYYKQLIQSGACIICIF